MKELLNAKELIKAEEEVAGGGRDGVPYHPPVIPIEITESVDVRAI